MKRVAGFTVIEILVVLVLVLVVLRIVFASALGAYERQLFARLGVDGDARLLLGIPLAIGLLYLRYGRASRRKQLSEPVPSWFIFSGVFVIVFGVGVIAWLFMA